MEKLLTYIENKWVNSTDNPPTSWSNFQRTIRTNNDVEGWHLRLKSILRVDHPNLYILINALYKEASQLNYQISLVQQGKLYRHRKKETKMAEYALQILWDNYGADERTIKTSEFLECCASLDLITISED